MSAAAIPPQTHRVTLRARPKALREGCGPLHGSETTRGTDNHPYLPASSVRAEPSMRSLRAPSCMNMAGGDRH